MNDIIILTPKQEEAIRTIVDRYNLGMRYTVLAGYAGVGKTTIIKYAIDALNIPPEKVAYVAYTGKAATVLKEKGCPNAMTAHKLLYHARQTKSGHYVFTPKKVLDYDYKMIVVDEVSMLPQDMWYQLLSHGVYVLAAGDPGQLSPVKDETNTVLEKPNIFLDEVLRQAQESAIIRLSMHIREGKDFRTFPTVSGEVRIIPRRYLFEDEDMTLLQADQIICGLNAQRFELNNKVRFLLNKGTEPEPGDKIISLKNHWDNIGSKGNPLTNGAIGELISYEHYIQQYPAVKRFENFQPTDLMITQFKLDGTDDEFIELPIDYLGLKNNAAALTGAQEYQIGGYNKLQIEKSMKYDNYPLNLLSIPYQFNYGYAITCWKSQGSQYNNVLAYDCGWLRKKNIDEYIRYLYTAVTRAIDRIILVGD